FSAPDSDRYNYLLPEVLAKIKVSLGGRVAEEVVFGEISTGAESDLEQLTELARRMVGRWGMSSTLGPVVLLPRDGAGGPFGGGRGRRKSPSGAKPRGWAPAARGGGAALRGETGTRLDPLARALPEQETPDEDAAYAAAGVSPPPAPPAEPLAKAARSTT